MGDEADEATIESLINYRTAIERSTTTAETLGVEDTRNILISCRPRFQTCSSRHPTSPNVEGYWVGSIAPRAG